MKKESTLKSKALQKVKDICTEINAALAALDKLSIIAKKQLTSSEKGQLTKMTSKPREELSLALKFYLAKRGKLSKLQPNQHTTKQTLWTNKFEALKKVSKKPAASLKNLKLPTKNVTKPVTTARR